jgi:hypothetical protein
MGSGGGGGSKQAKKTAKMQRQFSEQLFNESAPIRTELFGRSTDFLQGGSDPRETPTWEALKLATDSGFNQAKDNTIARFAPGGGLISAMTGLEGQRANTLSQGAANIYESELARAMALGTGMAQTGIAGLGSAGQTQASLAQANAAQSGAGKGALGSGLGMAAGGYLGNK